MSKTWPWAVWSLVFAVAPPMALGEASEPCTVVQGGRVYTPLGFRDGFAVRMQGGVITDVGPAVPRSGCELIDAAGAVLTPGLLDVHTHLGLVEVDLEAPTVDYRADLALGWAHARPSFTVATAYNPLSVAVPVTRLGGVTTVLTVPEAGLLAGQSAWVQLAGRFQSDAVLLATVAQHAAIGGGERSRADGLYALVQLLDEARDFMSREPAWRDNRAPAYRVPVSELRALAPVLEGAQPLVVEVNRAADIESVLEVGTKYGLKLILSGGAEAWMLAERLGRAQVPVIVDPLLNTPETFDRRGGRADNAALLHSAGVPVILSTFSTHNARLLRQVAGNAVRAGLSPDAALESVTLTPARVFGLAGAGKLEAGARADLVVWSADPFELSTRLQRLFIGGVAIPLRSRQTMLRDRYLTLPTRPSSSRKMPAP